MEEDGIGPLIEAKRKIEATMQVYLDKVAVLRKKAEALTAAVNVLRSNDHELLEMSQQASTKPKRTIKFDERVVEEEVVKLLREKGPQSKPNILMECRMRGIQATDSGIIRILKTSPDIFITGQRESTRYNAK